MSIAKIQSTLLSLLPFPPILTRDQCEILTEADNVVSNNRIRYKRFKYKSKRRRGKNVYLVIPLPFWRSIRKVK